MCGAQCVLVVALLVRLAHSWDFALTVGDRLEFYTDDGSKTATVLLTSQNMTALAYDEVHNMLLYVDKQNHNDSVCGYNMTSVGHKCFIERNGRNIQGLAFDPVTEMVFFTDTKERSINWFSFKPDSKNNVYGNLLIKMHDAIPTDISVDSCRGYIYWINTNLPKSTIERARFDGSDREVVITAKYNWNLHSLAIDQQSQKIYWMMPETSLISYTYSADLNGNNRNLLIRWSSDLPDIMTDMHPNSLTLSKKILFLVAWTSNSTKNRIWKFRKPSLLIESNNKMFQVVTTGVIGIAANYKIKDQFQGIFDCNHVLNNIKTEEIAREYCIHGIKVDGQCKCTPGYTGDRCMVSVCENYCFQGNCSFTEQGLPECRCEAGYSGERCEVNVCSGYCLNSGTCSLNEEDEAVCECVGEYEGERCQVPHEEDGPACHEGSGGETDKNQTNTTNIINYLEERAKNITLADLFENWRKHAQ